MPRCKLKAPGRLTIEDKGLGVFVKIVFDHEVEISDELATMFRERGYIDRVEIMGDVVPPTGPDILAQMPDEPPELKPEPEPEPEKPKYEEKPEKATKAKRTKPRRTWRKK